MDWDFQSLCVGLLETKDGEDAYAPQTGIGCIRRALVHTHSSGRLVWFFPP
jgi:hypothetical protein